MDRRDFLCQLGFTASTVALLEPALAQAPKVSANDKITACVMGVRGRGGSLLTTFASLPDVNVKYVCDIDDSVLESRVGQVESKTGKRPQGIKDYRKALDDKSVDILVNGGPDHWHALPTIHACQAGKDVYVEKPDSHNIIEGQTMVAAAQKYKKVVQIGTQSRSGPHLLSAMDYIRKGKLGKVQFAKAWESAKQGPIGYPKDGDPPKGVDYDMWLGPAPKRAFNSARFHGSWRWFFDYGTGDLGNDGVHRLDIARWAMDTGLASNGKTVSPVPRSVASFGGKYYFDDAQEWPDTLMTTYDFPGCVLTYEMRVWSAYPLHEESEGAALYGDQGFVVIGNGRWRAFDAKGKLVTEEAGTYSNDIAHAQNFLECVRSRKKPAADLETVGHPSSLLCHLGNAAWRAGRSLAFDPTTYTFKNDKDANQFLTRSEYRKPWVLPSLADV